VRRVHGSPCGGLALYGLPLHQRYEEATGAEMRNRYQMIVLAQLGHTAPSIARLVLRCEDTVARVFNRFLAARLNAVPRHISPSRKRTVTPAWEAELLRVIELDPFFMLEEDTVVFTPDRGKDGCRGLRCIRDKLKILLLCAPLDGCRVLDQTGIKVVHLVAEVNTALHTMPTHLERGFRLVRFPTH
jgi:hypothetical protein